MESKLLGMHTPPSRRFEETFLSVHFTNNWTWQLVAQSATSRMRLIHEYKRSILLVSKIDLKCIFLAIANLLINLLPHLPLSSACMFHNWIRKLILRLKKYQARGIEVIGAPAIGEDFEIDELALQSHGVSWVIQFVIDNRIFTYINI